LSLWHELENLQKKKADLEDQLISLEERSKILEQKLKDQEERVHVLIDQLKSKTQVVEKLESTIIELEKKLKKPEREPEISIALTK